MPKKNEPTKPKDLRLPDGKLPPQNLDAEVSLLGAVLIDEDVLTRVTDKLAADDFYDRRHELIFGAMLRLYEQHKAVDLLTLSDELKKKGELDDAGGAAYLTDLSNQVPTAAHAENYAQIVTQNAMRRRLISASARIAELGFDESGNIDDLLQGAEAHLFAVSDKSLRQDLVSLEQILTESFDRMEELHHDKTKIRGVKTGYRDMDNLLAGFQRSDLIILASRPAMGKSTFALNLSHNIAVQEKQAVLFFSLEMSKEQLVDRMLSDEAGVDAWNIRTGNLNDEDFEKLSNAMGVLAEAPIYIDDTPGLSVLEMRTKARRAAHEHPLGLIVVDYLQLMSTSGRSYSDNRVQEISEISRGLKLIAREMNVPVLALSQLSRTVESRNPPHPQLSDLRESGCLTGESLITLADTGARVPIRNLVDKRDLKVWALNEKTLRLEAATVSNAFPTGKKPVYKLTTRLGRTIRATGNHKFRNAHEWRRLDELIVGDRIALPRALATSKNDTVSFSEAALLGHLIGDGCTLPRHTIQYTTQESDLATKVAELATLVFGQKVKPRINPERGWYQVYLPSSKRLTHGVHNPIAAWLDSLGVFGLRSHQKHVPETMFEQSKETIGVFLKHLWSTDGCIRPPSGKRRHPTIYYASSSEHLARDVQSLLLRLGINAILRASDQGSKGRTQYHVSITGKDDILSFAKNVGAVGSYKTTSLTECEAYVLNRLANTNRDTVPHTIWRKNAVPAMQVAGMTSRQLQAGLGMAYSGTNLYKQNIGRERMLRLAQIVGSNQISALATSDVYWDSIISIEPDGEEQVYDLTVPGPSNFVANDIIVHNSIEQDADIVMFIYREDYYNPETDRQHIADIMVKKHRNGPTGNVELYFHPERVKFMTLDKRH